MPPGHHRFDATAELVAVSALRVTSARHGVRARVRFDPALAPQRGCRVGDPAERGLRALTAPPRSANGGTYVMAGLIAADTLPMVDAYANDLEAPIGHDGPLP